MRIDMRSEGRYINHKTVLSEKTFLASTVLINTVRAALAYFIWFKGLVTFIHRALAEKLRAVGVFHLFKMFQYVVF